MKTKEEQLADELVRQELDRKVYRSLKRDLIGIEEENYGEVILQKCSGKGDWFEIADHSALIYYYYVIQVLKIKNIRFEDDYDSYYEQYRIGRIRVRGVDTVRKRLKDANMYYGEHVLMGRIVFILKKPLSKDKMRILEKRESRRRMNLNKTIEVEHSSPLFYRNLAELDKWLHQVCSSKLGKLASQTNGVRMVTLADEMMAKYLHSTDLPGNKIEAREDDWKEIRKRIYKLKYEIQIIDIVGLWSPEVCLKAFEKNDILLKLANENLIKIVDEKKGKG